MTFSRHGCYYTFELDLTRNDTITPITIDFIAEF